MKDPLRFALLLLPLLVIGCTNGGRRYDAPLPAPVLATRAPAPLPPPPQPPPLPPVSGPRSLAGTTIVVDAGHGGKDPGARGVSSVPEKTITLAVARRLGSLLEERGARVIYTRTTDRFISLPDRAALADRVRPDLFVSIHADAARRASSTGSTLYIARGPGGVSQRVAGHLSTSLSRAGIACRGVRSAGFQVLVGHRRPAVLVECGFLTNPTEAQRLGTSAYQEQLATALANGIAAALGR